jgi:hypothetical protein
LTLLREKFVFGAIQNDIRILAIDQKRKTVYVEESCAKRFTETDRLCEIREPLIHTLAGL